ncbi:MAG: hypothetical protein GXP62_06705 [Oligoflexia bacterium]|nr:hypothetical protein [Oligoflexia bacterium]
MSIPAELWLGLSGLSLVLALTSLALVPALLVRLPVDFVTTPPPSLRQRVAAASLTGLLVLLLRNALGAFLVLLGVVMLFTPGQGVLTVVAGLALTDGPGRHRVIVWVLRKRMVARVVQRLRARRGVTALDGLDATEPPTG